VLVSRAGFHLEATDQYLILDLSGRLPCLSEVKMDDVCLVNIKHLQLLRKDEGLSFVLNLDGGPRPFRQPDRIQLHRLCI
jgi:hypothetical protein